MSFGASVPAPTSTHRTPADARRWMRLGSALFLKTVGDLDEQAYGSPSLLPGWTRKHLVGHVAANADALVNLVHWAATGVPTPMYANPQERAAGIERGSTLSGPALNDWLRRSDGKLELALASLTDEQWRAEVVTAQGRTVPASEILWMRTREVLVHAVDLDRGVTFADLPADALQALVADICTKRGLAAADLPDGPLADVTAWLAGRPHRIADAPQLGPWL